MHIGGETPDPPGNCVPARTNDKQNCVLAAKCKTNDVKLSLKPLNARVSDKNQSGSVDGICVSMQITSQLQRGPNEHGLVSRSEADRKIEQAKETSSAVLERGHRASGAKQPRERKSETWRYMKEEPQTKGKRVRLPVTPEEPTPSKRRRQNQALRDANSPVCGRSTTSQGMSKSVITPPLVGAVDAKPAGVAPLAEGCGADNDDALKVLEEMEEPVTPPSIDENGGPAGTGCPPGETPMLSRPASPRLEPDTMVDSADQAPTPKEEWIQVCKAPDFGNHVDATSDSMLLKPHAPIGGQTVEREEEEMEVEHFLSGCKPSYRPVESEFSDAVNTEAGAQHCGAQVQVDWSEPSPSNPQDARTPQCLSPIPCPPEIVIGDRFDGGGPPKLGHFTSDKENSGVQAVQGASSVKDVDTLLKENRLCLVLDLDHTLLNSCKFSEVEPKIEEVLNKKSQQEEQRAARDQQLFKLTKLGMWTKLRPGLRAFLDRAKDSFELWIHTNGNRCRCCT